MSDHTVLAVAEDYLTELAESGRPANTIRAYEGDLSLFVKFLTTERKCISAKQLESIDDTDVLDYIVKTHGKNKASTAARALSVISEWFNFLGRRGYVSHNPVWDLERPKIPERVPRIPSVAKANDLCDSVCDCNSSWPARDRAMLELLYGCGVLVSQLVELNVQSIHFDPNFILVKRKAGKEPRRLPMGEYAAEALNKYLAERTAKLKSCGQSELLSSGPLFLNLQLRNLKKPSAQARLTARSVGRIVKNIAVRCGFSSRMNPRTLRIAYAAHMLNQGADLRHVQEFLGNISATAALRILKIANDHSE